MILSVLIVDDEEAVRAALAQSFELADIPATTADSVAAALKALAVPSSASPPSTAPGAIVSDVRMPGEDGFSLLARVAEIDAEIPVVLLTGHGDVPMAVRAMSNGAYDFLEKPAAPARLIEIVKRALEKRRLVLENRALKRWVADLDNLRLSGRSNRIVLGDAPASIQFRTRLEALAQVDADVLIVGETGAGKEGAARALHALSGRKRGPFVAVNCGGLSGELAKAELFGQTTGAYPGAGPARPGRFEQAEGGVLFLDEIEEPSMDLQVALLRVLEEREVWRLGASSPIRIDVRVIAAAKVDLAELVSEGRLRPDLAYRLDVARLKTPALRDRIQDLPLLFDALVANAAADAGLTTPHISAELRGRLALHDWPGNIRELRNVAERFVQGFGYEVGATASDPQEAAPAGLTARMEAYERQVLTEALTQAKGKAAEAAAALSLPRKTFYDRLAKHGLSAADFRR